MSREDNIGLSDIPLTKKVRILSVDGGGVRGVIPATIVAAIEAELQRRLSDPQARLAQYLDILAGTSTGAILTALYLIPDPTPSISDLLSNPSKQFKFSAADALCVYLKEAPKIFGTNAIGYMWSIAGYDGPLYSAKPLEEMLVQYVGELRLDQLNKVYMAMAYDIDNGEPYIFASRGIVSKSNDPMHGHVNYLIRDAIRATSAAPTYFAPAAIVPVERSINEVKHFIDGGMAANNPAMSAVSVAKVIYGADEPVEIVMISISCGRMRDICSYDKAKNWGKIGWVVPVISITMDSNSRLTDLEVAEQLRGSGHYFRFDTPLKQAAKDMDDASPKNLAALQADANEYLALPETQKMIRDVVDLILVG
jgi:patatin-like phospholipase/acyl hydrolase